MPKVKLACVVEALFKRCLVPESVAIVKGDSVLVRLLNPRKIRKAVFELCLESECGGCEQQRLQRAPSRHWMSYTESSRLVGRFPELGDVGKTRFSVDCPRRISLTFASCAFCFEPVGPSHTSIPRASNEPDEEWPVAGRWDEARRRGASSKQQAARHRSKRMTGVTRTS